MSRRLFLGPMAVAGAAVIALSVLTSCTAQDKPGPEYQPRTRGIKTLKPGDEAPSFYLRDVQTRERLALTDMKENRAVVLIWVSPQCPVSRDYEGRMKDLAAQYKSKKIVFIGINSNFSEPAEAVAKHFQDHNVGFPVLKDPENAVADQYGAMVTPEVFLVDQKGIIRYHGAIDDSQEAGGVKQTYLADALASFVANNPIKPDNTKAFGCSLKRVKK